MFLCLASRYLLVVAPLLLLVTLVPAAKAVTMEECKADYLPTLLECLDNDTRTTPCENLPIPESAFPTIMANELAGYSLQHLRDTPTSHVFALGDNSYNSLIVVDVAPMPDASRQRVLQKHGLRGHRGLEEEEPSFDEMFNMPEEESNDEGGALPVTASSPGSITFALIDFPENYYQYGEDGSIVGYHVLSAVSDVLSMLNATLDDVAKVEMIYSHAHMDHIGAASYSYDAVSAVGIEDVSIVASGGTYRYLEELIEAGVYSNRAPLPTMTFEESTDPSSINYGNTWLGFGTYLGAVADYCARKTLEQYGCTFAALDVIIKSHCDVTQSFLRVDA